MGASEYPPPAYDKHSRRVRPLTGLHDHLQIQSPTRRGDRDFCRLPASCPDAARSTGAARRPPGIRAHARPAEHPAHARPVQKAALARIHRELRGWPGVDRGARHHQRSGGPAARRRIVACILAEGGRDDHADQAVPAASAGGVRAAITLRDARTGVGHPERACQCGRGHWLGHPAQPAVDRDRLDHRGAGRSEHYGHTDRRNEAFGLLPDLAPPLEHAGHRVQERGLGPDQDCRHQCNADGGVPAGCHAGAGLGAALRQNPHPGDVPLWLAACRGQYRVEYPDLHDRAERCVSGRRCFSGVPSCHPQA